MKNFVKLSLFMFLLVACGPLVPVTPEGVLQPEVNEYQDYAYDIVWSQDDLMIAIKTATGLYVYDAANQKELFAFDGFGGLNGVFGEKYFAAVDGNNLYVWDLKEFELLFRVTAEEQGQINSLAISPSDKMLVTGELKQLRFWSLPDGKLIDTTPAEIVASDMKFKNADRLVVASGYFGNVREWDVKGLKLIRTFDFEKPVVSLRLSQDGQLVIVDYGLTGFQLWDVDTGKLKQNYGDIVSASGWQRLSGDNHYAVVWGYAFDSQNSGMSVWDLVIHLHIQEFTTPFVNGDGWRCGALNSDGSILAAGDNQGYVYFYNVKTGEKTGEFFLPYKYTLE